MLRRSTLLGVFVAAIAAPVAAQNIKYTVSGTVSLAGIGAGTPEIWDSVMVGDSFSYEFEMDPTVVPSPNAADHKSFQDSIVSASLTMGGVSAQITSPSPASYFDVFDNYTLGSDCFDALTIVAEAGGVDDIDFVGIDIQEGTPLPACPTTSLASSDPPLSLDLTDFGTARLALWTSDFGSYAGPITSLTITQVPVNDDCADAIALPSNFATTAYDATGATTDGADATGFCDYGAFGDEQNDNDVWFTYTPDVGGCTYITTLGLAGYDTRLTVYDGNACPDDPAMIIACADEEVLPAGGFFEAGLDVNLTAGITYTIRLGTFSESTFAGAGSIMIAAGPGADVNSGGANPGAPGCVAFPANDDCANAIALPSAFADTAYDATFATTDGVDSTGFCDYGGVGDEQNHRDVWFTYTPDTGGCTYISTMNLAGYDTRLTVYDTADCPDDPASIVACADDETQPPSFPFESGLDVDLQQGRTYLIRLGTFDETTLPSTGTLRIAQGPQADLGSGGLNPGAPGCAVFNEFCNGDGGNQMGCTNCPCMNNAAPGTIGGCLNSASTSARLIPSGSPSVLLAPGSVTDLRFGLTGAPPLAFCILNSGDNLAPSNPANPCFGLDTGAQAVPFDGLRCAIQNTRRHGGRSADANGDVGVTNNPWGGEGGPPAGIAVAGAGFVAGQTRFFQVVNRDDAQLSCMRGLNTSQAVRVSFTAEALK